MHTFCSRCGSTVNANPPLFHCPTCDADLSDQTTSEAGPIFLPEGEVQGYYQRAAALALTKNDVEALTIIEHGLHHFSAPELHLLAALIHRRRNEYDQMRRHVAAIPVDDVLRPEAEWLLRSHQEQQRALRQAVHQKKSKKQYLPLDAAAIPMSAADQFLLEEFGEYRPGRRKQRSHTWVVSLPLLVLIVVLAWWQAPLLKEWAELAIFPATETIQPAVEAAGESPQSTERLDAPAAVEPDPTPEPTAPPTSTPLPNLVEAPIPTVDAEVAASPEPLAASGTASALIVLTSAERGFDLSTYLKLMGRSDLAELDIAAHRQDQTMVLAGVVPSTQARVDLIAQTAKVPGVTEVNAIDLLIRLPETYIVQQDDTLWSIAYILYGDGIRWQEILDANQELLKDGTLLSPGQVLVVPPL